MPGAVMRVSLNNRRNGAFDIRSRRRPEPHSGSEQLECSRLPPPVVPPQREDTALAASVGGQRLHRSCRDSTTKKEI